MTGRPSSRRRRAPALDKAERQALLLRYALQGFARRGKAGDRFDLNVLTGKQMAPRGIETRIGELVRACELTTGS